MNLNEVKKPEKFNTMHEVAVFMGISYMSLYRLVKNGEIETINIAKSGKKPIFAFTPEAVQAYYDNVQNSLKRT